MKISSKSRYAIRAILYLARNLKENGHISLKEISEKENISIKYLEQIFIFLKKSNIVKSIKGSYGGYILAKKSTEITIGDIIRAVDGNVSSIEDNPKDSLDYYMIENYWKNLDKIINEYLDKKNISELLEEYSKLNKNNDNIIYSYRNSYF